MLDGDGCLGIGALAFGHGGEWRWGVFSRIGAMRCEILVLTTLEKIPKLFLAIYCSIRGVADCTCGICRVKV